MCKIIKNIRIMLDRKSIGYSASISSSLLMIMLLLDLGGMTANANPFQQNIQQEFAQELTHDMPLANLYVNSRDETALHVSIDADEMYLLDLLHELANRVQVEISIHSETIRNRKVSYSAHNRSIYSVLDDLLADNDLEYTLQNDRKLLIIKNTEESFQQLVTGQVSDAETGESLPGVNIVVQGTNFGTTTDVNGEYTIEVEGPESILQFTYIGYSRQEVSVGDQDVIDIDLLPDLEQLDEVVVVGYGEQRRLHMTGSVGQVSFDEQMSSRSVSNLSSALSGLLPGMSVQQHTGMAGQSGSQLQIRGMGTVNNSSPLVVVDGMPDVDINRIDMRDVESVSVLKDAAAAAIYGSRAANGVIVITTKSGSRNQPATINYTSTVGFSQPTNFYDYLADYPRAMTLHMRAANAGHVAPSHRQGTVEEWFSKGMVDPIRYPNTNQWDEVLRTGQLQTHNISASGGSDNLNFFISAGLMDETGLQINNDYSRKNARVNLDYDIRDNIRVGTRLDGSWTDMTAPRSDGMTDPTGSGWDMQAAIAGILPVHPETGQFGGHMAYGEDPFAENLVASYTFMNRETKRNELNANLYGVLEPIEGLNLRADFGLRNFNQFYRNWSDPTIAYNFQTGQEARIRVQPNAGVSNSMNQGYKTHFQTRITFDREIFNGHNLGLLAGLTEEYWFNRSLSGSRMNRIHPSLIELNAALPEVQSASGTSSSEGLRSLIGRVNYVIEDKYLIEGSLRYDGSSKFLDDYQYGFFPSMAVGWVFTMEDFFPTTFLYQGKLRASIGKLGNNSGVGRFEQTETYAQTNYSFGGELAQGFSANKLINRNLSWEETRVINFGLELGFLDNRLTAEIDVYDRLTTGMIRPSSLSTLLAGYSAPRTNIGDLQNQGIEMTIGYQSALSTVQYDVRLNLAYNRNRLLDWNQHLTKGNVFLDLPYNYVYTREAVGIAQGWEDIQNAAYQNQSHVAPGDVIYKDLNGDGQITSEDRRAYPNFMRSSFPYQAGLNFAAAWRGFDLHLLLQAGAGRKDFWREPLNSVHVPQTRYAFQAHHWNDTWNLDNREASMPRIISGSGGSNHDQSTFWLDNLSYLRFKNVQIGYNLPITLIDRIGINQFRVYAAAENIFTLSSYRGIDPEKAASNNDPYPLLRTISLGVNITL